VRDKDPDIACQMRNSQLYLSRRVEFAFLLSWRRLYSPRAIISSQFYALPT